MIYVIVDPEDITFTELIDLAFRAMNYRRMPGVLEIGDVQVSGRMLNGLIAIWIAYEKDTVVSVSIWTGVRPQIHMWDDKLARKAIGVLRAHFVLDDLANI